ncbi:unnamed protein product, partial [Meganyctiphanes norvegica]
MPGEVLTNMAQAQFNGRAIGSLLKSKRSHNSLTNKKKREIILKKESGTLVKDQVINVYNNSDNKVLYEWLKLRRLFAHKDPILPGCMCHTCQNFSCSYIHHLLNTKELLAPVLLMIYLNDRILFLKSCKMVRI